MLSPNTMQNTMTGRAENTAPSGSVTPSRRAPWPSWNTSVSAPNAAATERRLSTTALMGTSTERNPRNSASMVLPTTSARISQNRPATASW